MKNCKRGRFEGEDDVETEDTSGVKRVYRGDSPAETLPRLVHLVSHVIPSPCPREVVVEVLGYLADPRDLARAAQVCTSWEAASKDPALWRCLPLSQWQKVGQGWSMTIGHECLVTGKCRIMQSYISRYCYL